MWVTTSAPALGYFQRNSLSRLRSTAGLRLRPLPLRLPLGFLRGRTAFLRLLPSSLRLRSPFLRILLTLLRLRPALLRRRSLKRSRRRHERIRRKPKRSRRKPDPRRRRAGRRQWGRKRAYEPPIVPAPVARRREAPAWALTAPGKRSRTTGMDTTAPCGFSRLDRTIVTTFFGSLLC